MTVLRQAAPGVDVDWEARGNRCCGFVGGCGVDRRLCRRCDVGIAHDHPTRSAFDHQQFDACREGPHHVLGRAYGCGRHGSLLLVNNLRDATARADIVRSVDQRDADAGW